MSYNKSYFHSVLICALISLAQFLLSVTYTYGKHKVILNYADLHN